MDVSKCGLNQIYYGFKEESRGRVTMNTVSKAGG